PRQRRLHCCTLRQPLVYRRGSLRREQPHLDEVLLHGDARRPFSRSPPLPNYLSSTGPGPYSHASFYWSCHSGGIAEAIRAVCCGARPSISAPTRSPVWVWRHTRSALPSPSKSRTVAVSGGRASTATATGPGPAATNPCRVSSPVRRSAV